MSPRDFSFMRKAVLRTGTIFRGRISEVTSPLAHFLILLNKDPQNDDQYCLIVASSQVQHIPIIKKKFGDSTVVEIPSGTNPFTKDTFLNCNSVYVKNVRDIEERYKTGELAIVHQLSGEILAKVIYGVMASSKVSDEIKSLLPD